jgi:hypothetical protein
LSPSPFSFIFGPRALEAFINELEAQRGKKIPEAVADALIAKAQGIIAELSGGT